MSGHARLSHRKSPRPFIRSLLMLYQTGENNVPTPSQTIGSLPARPPRAEAILGTSDPAQISSTGCATTRNPEMHRLAHVSSHVFDAFEKCGYGIQSHAGTLSAFNSAINLGCVYPGNHGSQTRSSGSSLVPGVFAGSERNIAILVRRRCSVRKSTSQEGHGPK